MEGDADPSVNNATTESENADDEIIEINGDEVMVDDEPSEPEQDTKIEIDDHGDTDRNTDENRDRDSTEESDDEKGDEDGIEDDGAIDDHNDEDYDGDKILKYRNKKGRKSKKVSKNNKLKKPKDVLIPQMVIEFLN